jgi:monolysocardiolipin acyltransferase
MPEKHWFGRRPLLPLCLKNINIVVGEPMEFDLSTLQRRAESESRVLRASGDEYIEGNKGHLDSSGWPTGLCKGLDEIAQKWLFVHLSDHIRNAMQKLCVKARSLNNSGHT